MFTTTVERVESNTSETANERIQRRIDQNIAQYRGRSAAAIRRRLRQLDREWDVERWLETMAPSFTLLGLLLARRFNRKWLALSAVVQSFFLQHALQGWCPPIPLLRRLGVRTMNEIQRERDALTELAASKRR